VREEVRRRIRKIKGILPPDKDRKRRVETGSGNTRISPAVFFGAYWRRGNRALFNSNPSVCSVKNLERREAQRIASSH
jgi:hypothetical protein